MSNSCRCSTSTESAWHPQPLNFPQESISKPEEIQIALLGAPGSGKTRLLSRYILRQFMNIESEGAQRMGCHKHLRLLDGTEVHLIIHELRTEISRGSSNSANSPASRHEEEIYEARQRKKLLQQSDAVMLVFNPLAKETYEWINDELIEDITSAGQKNQLRGDVSCPTNSFAGGTPPPKTPTRSTPSFSTKKLPWQPDLPLDGDSELPFFSSDGEQQQKQVRSCSSDGEKPQEEERVDYSGELKRISILVEDSALKKAEFLIHEKDLSTPSPPPQSSSTPSRPSPTFTPRTNVTGRQSSTIRELGESSWNSKGMARVSNRQHLPIMKHDSLMSMQSVSTISSAHSAILFGAVSASAEQGSAQTFVGEEQLTFQEVGHVADEPSEERVRRTAKRMLNEEEDVPILVVATRTDELKAHGGALERLVTAEEGRLLSRKLGPNCVYIETSAKTNFNVDKAFGVIVEKFMAKRAIQPRKELTRARFEATIAAMQERSGPVTRLKVRTRSCMPFFFPMPVLETLAGVVARAFATSVTTASPNSDESLSASAHAIEEDLWGDCIEANSTRHSPWQSRKILPQGQDSDPRDAEVEGRRASALNWTLTSTPASGIMFYEHAATPTPTTSRNVNMMTEMSENAIPKKQQPKLAVRTKDDGHQLTKDDVASPNMTAMGLVNPNGPGSNYIKKQPTMPKLILPGSTAVKDTVGGPARTAVHLGRSYGGGVSRPGSVSPNAELHGHNPIGRKSIGSPKFPTRAYVTNSNISDHPQYLPPPEFDASVESQASMSILLRAVDQEPHDEQKGSSLAKDVTRDSYFMMLSPFSAIRTSSASTKDMKSARVSGIPKASWEGLRAQRKSRRASEVLAVTPPLVEGETWQEKIDALHRVTLGGAPIVRPSIDPAVVEYEENYPTNPTSSVPQISYLPTPAAKKNRRKPPPGPLSRRLPIETRSSSPLCSPIRLLVPSGKTQVTDRSLAPFLPEDVKPISSTAKDATVTITELTAESP